jgi:hypothetical protein
MTRSVGVTGQRPWSRVLGAAVCAARTGASPCRQPATVVGDRLMSAPRASVVAVSQPPRHAAALLLAGAAAVDLASQPKVAAAWDAPSALQLMTVGGVAAHLLGQLSSTLATLDEPLRSASPVALDVHYDRVQWRGRPLDAATNVSIRDGSQESASAGPVALLDRATADLAELAARLVRVEHDTLVQQPWTQWPLALDDFLLTRLMELSVHMDDLAVSVGLPTPALPAEVTGPVRHLLVDLAAGRHGEVAVLRALSRAERAPSTVTAF